MKRAILVSAMIAAGVASAPALANVSGAIWTTLQNADEVDGNIYAAKEDVYLNGGPGKGAGTNAPGLSPQGTYIFMVTDPSGKTLLSQDPAACRQVTVSGGIITDVVPAGGCEHALGSALVGRPVQLIPYADTPNNGGEYKAWLTPLTSYACRGDLTAACTDGTFGFVDSESKTDNFKVNGTVDEIDTRFYDTDGNILDGRGITWTDTLGASNAKYSYYAPQIDVNHEAHVEAPEVGTHFISIQNQPGCTVGNVAVAGVNQKKAGPQTVPVRVTQGMKKKGTFTVFVDVTCTATQ